jgi:hypothetical protein
VGYFLDDEFFLEISLRDNHLKASNDNGTIKRVVRLVNWLTSLIVFGSAAVANHLLDMLVSMSLCSRAISGSNA